MSRPEFQIDLNQLKLVHADVKVYKKRKVEAVFRLTLAQKWDLVIDYDRSRWLAEMQRGLSNWGEHCPVIMTLGVQVAISGDFIMIVSTMMSAQIFILRAKLSHLPFYIWEMLAETGSWKI